MRVPVDDFWSARSQNPVENDPPEHTHRHAAGQQSRRFARSRMISARKSGPREPQIRSCGPRDEANEGGAKAGAHGFAVGSRRRARARYERGEHMGCATWSTHLIAAWAAVLRGASFSGPCAPCPLAAYQYSAAAPGVGGGVSVMRGCLHMLSSHLQYSVFTA